MDEDELAAALHPSWQYISYIAHPEFSNRSSPACAKCVNSYVARCSVTIIIGNGLRKVATGEIEDELHIWGGLEIESDRADAKMDWFVYQLMRQACSRDHEGSQDGQRETSWVRSEGPAEGCTQYRGAFSGACVRRSRNFANTQGSKR